MTLGRALLLAALALLASAPGAGGAAGQEPEPQDTAAVPAIDTPQAPASTVRPIRSAATAPPRVALSATVGTLGFSDLQVQPVLASRPGGGTGESWRLRRTVSASSGYHVQGSALVNFGPAWGLRVGLGVGRADLEVGYSGGGTPTVVQEIRDLPAVTLGRLDLVSAEAALRFRIPAARRFVPYLELGVARDWWSLADEGSPILPGMESLLDPPARTGAHMAIGATFPLRGRVDGRLQVTTRYLRTPLTPGERVTGIGGGDSLAVTLVAPETGAFSDATVELTRVMRLEAGVTFRLGAIRETPPPPPAGSGAGSSGTRR